VEFVRKRLEREMCALTLSHSTHSQRCVRVASRKCKPASWRISPRFLRSIHSLPRAASAASSPRRSEALRAGRGTLADAGGSSAAAAASGGRSGGGGGGGGSGAAVPPFTFATSGVRLFTAGISVLKGDVDAVRAFAATT
jgi:hypothetical protein